MQTARRTLSSSGLIGKLRALEILNIYRCDHFYIICINPPQADAYIQVEENEEEEKEQGSRPKQEKEHTFLRWGVLVGFEQLQILTCRPLAVESKKLGRLTSTAFATAKMSVFEGMGGRRLWAILLRWWGWREREEM